MFSKLFILRVLIYSILWQNPSSETSTPLLSRAQSYAETMIQHGKDHYGSEYSEMLASALNRQSLTLDSTLSSISIPGVRVRDRSITGANLIHDIDLYHVLYLLSDVTGDQIFAEEADKAMKYFFEHCQSETTGLLCWGEHLFWDFYSDDCGHSRDYDFHEAKVWPFWEKSYSLAPDVYWRFILSEWDHQIDDQRTGDFSRHARYSRHETFSGFDFPRYAGQMIERWADAYQRPENKDKARREELRSAIEIVFNRMVDNSRQSKTGLLIAGRSEKGDHRNIVWPNSNLELARCLVKAAPIMETPLAERMEAFSLKLDQDFLEAPHTIQDADGGFAATLDAATGQPRSRSMNKPFSTTWGSGYGYGTHAETALICIDRFRNLKDKHPAIANEYKYLAETAAQKYLSSVPDTTQLIKPREFSTVIELMLHAFEITEDPRYIERADFFADMAISLFLDDDIPLPKASNQHNHYESITGGPSFILQLLKLHIARQGINRD